MKERTYSKEEIAALLERAAELHALEANSITDKPGLTLSEIEEIASDSGIDPLLVRQAATEISGAPRVSSLKTKDTTATHNIVERIIPGSLPPDVWEDIVFELRHRYENDLNKMMGGSDSTTEQIGRSVQWKHTSVSGIETRVLIRPRGNKLHLILRQMVGWGGSWAESITYGSILAFLAGAFSGGPTDSVLIGSIVLIATLAIAIPLIYWADQTWRKKKHRELDGLADRISNMIILAEDDPEEEAETVSEPISEAEFAPSEQEQAASRIDDTLLEPDKETEESSDSGSQKSKARSS